MPPTLQLEDGTIDHDDFRRAPELRLELLCSIAFFPHSVPRYLSDFCTPVANVAARSQLRSARRHLVVVPRYNRSTYARRAFSVAGPVLFSN